MATTDDASTASGPACPVLLLAAGASRRMGRAKALLPWGEGCLLDHAIGQARNIGSPVWVVGGRYYPLMRYRCQRQPQRWLFNPDWEQGMAASLAAGLQAMPTSATGVFIVLLDQPLIEAAALVRFRQEALASPDAPLAADYDGRPGVPAYLPRALWGPAQGITGDRGASSMLRQVGARRIEMPGVKSDLDTPRDWHRHRLS